MTVFQDALATINSRGRKQNGVDSPNPEPARRRTSRCTLRLACSGSARCQSFESSPRLRNSEVEKLFPEQSPVAIHCIEQSADSHRLIRVKAVDPNSHDSAIVRSLRKTVFQTTELPGLRPWVQTGRYSFSILAETESRVQRIRQLIQSDEQLCEFATFIVEQAPGVRTLNKALHDRQN